MEHSNGYKKKLNQPMCLMLHGYYTISPRLTNLHISFQRKSFSFFIFLFSCSFVFRTTAETYKWELCVIIVYWFAFIDLIHRVTCLFGAIHIRKTTLSCNSLYIVDLFTHILTINNTHKHKKFSFKLLFAIEEDIAPRRTQFYI